MLTVRNMYPKSTQCTKNCTTITCKTNTWNKDEANFIFFKHECFVCILGSKELNILLFSYVFYNFDINSIASPWYNYNPFFILSNWKYFRVQFPCFKNKYTSSYISCHAITILFCKIYFNLSILSFSYLSHFISHYILNFPTDHYGSNLVPTDQDFHFVNVLCVTINILCLWENVHWTRHVG